jgi:hypothetical protein
MRRLPLLILGALVACGVFAAASAGVPPKAPGAQITVSRVSPVAGQRFTGLIAITQGQRITRFKCDAEIDGKTLAGRLRRFDGHGWGISKPAAVSCSWLIPAGTAGKVLRTSGYRHAAWLFTTGNSGDTVSASWRIR